MYIPVFARPLLSTFISTPGYIHRLLSWTRGIPWYSPKETNKSERNRIRFISSSSRKTWIKERNTILEEIDKLSIHDSLRSIQCKLHCKSSVIQSFCTVQRWLGSSCHYLRFLKPSHFNREQERILKSGDISPWSMAPEEFSSQSVSHSKASKERKILQ